MKRLMFSNGLMISKVVILRDPSSSIGPLALYFGWKRRHKEEFAEIASGVLASSFIHGDPMGTVTAIVVLAYRYTNQLIKLN